MSAQQRSTSAKPKSEEAENHIKTPAIIVIPDAAVSQTLAADEENDELSITASSSSSLSVPKKESTELTSFPNAETLPLHEIPAPPIEEIEQQERNGDEEKQEVTDDKQGYETSLSISLSLSLTKLLAKSDSSSSSSGNGGEDDGGGGGNLRHDSCSEEIGKWSEDLQRTALNDTTKKERYRCK